jgi:PBP1b-binding outer membrane lipoprotein LpoB
MKNSSTLILCLTITLLLTACGDEPKENRTKAVKNPADTYLDSRVNAMESLIK